MDISNLNKTRRSAIKTMFATVIATGANMLGIAHGKTIAKAEMDDPIIKKFPSDEQLPQDMPPLYSGAVVHNGLVYVSGKGEHGEGDISVHTDKVLNKIEAELVKAGSSMEKALQVNVFLHDIRDYRAMNEVYRGRFGENPPVRTTVACYGGLPGNSLVEINCIAAI